MAHKDTSHPKDSLQSKRAKARWKMLRSTIVTSTSTEDTSWNAFSIHRFPGFQLLDRRSLSVNDNGTKELQYRERLSKFALGEDHNLHHDWYIMFHSTNGKDEPSGTSKDAYECIEYTLPEPLVAKGCVSHKDKIFSRIKFRTRERVTRLCDMNEKEQTKRPRVTFSLSDLMSHTIHGVDNTGTIQVWDSASVLAHVLNRCWHVSDYDENKQPYDTLPFRGLDFVPSLAQTNSDDQNILRVVELGAGMAGIPSLSLVALDLAFRTGSLTGYTHDIPHIHVTLTDGHPSAVRNNTMCGALTSALYHRNGECIHCDCCSNVYRHNIRSCKLLWKDNDVGARECQSLLQQNKSEDGKSHPFDLCLVSDCTHFTDHHAALVATIGRLLKVGGACILCQPKRGGSLNRFRSMIYAINKGIGAKLNSKLVQKNGLPLFDMNVYHRYDDRIYEKHNTFLNDCKNKEGTERLNYDPDIHYPLLLTLTKLREYEEDVDTKIAIANKWSSTPFMT